ncbi:MAG: hypothetical protein QOG48_303 [Verrucomicrobiota bacterium]|jgi:glycosyltransferase involved in cell wall biosynthesis
MILAANVLPEFSIVTPSYNQLDWLRLALASVADQTSATVEHIIQDAGSKDINEIIEKLTMSGPANCEVRLFLEKDSGMYDAINRGLAKARGNICAWLNSDEQYLPNALHKVANFFAENPKIDILFGDVLVVDAHGKALSCRRAILPSPNHVRLSHLNTSSCATFFRRSVFEQGHRFDPNWKSIGDGVWVYGMLKAGLRAATYPNLLSAFTLTGANLSMDDPVSQSEKEKWLAQPDAPAKIFRPYYVALHRVKKFLAGAYRKRTFDYEIYTLDSPSRRVRFTAYKVGGTWKVPSTKTNDADHPKR